MITVSVNQLQENLMQFLEKVEAGETILIMLQSHTIARIVPFPLTDKMKKAREALRQLRKNAVVGDMVSSLEEESGKLFYTQEWLRLFFSCILSWLSDISNRYVDYGSTYRLLFNVVFRYVMLHITLNTLTKQYAQ